jgi:hypothetical protein
MTRRERAKVAERYKRICKIELCDQPTGKTIREWLKERRKWGRQCPAPARWPWLIKLIPEDKR